MIIYVITVCLIMFHDRTWNGTIMAKKGLINPG